jgi:Domain of unknown function (DUF4349)
MSTFTSEGIMGKRFLAALSLTLLGLVAVSCSGGDSDQAGGADTGRVREAEANAEAPVPALAQDEDSSGGSAATDSYGDGGGGSGGGDAGSTGDVYGGGPSTRGAGLPDLGLSVIKSATVTLEVEEDELQETLQNATSSAEKYGGFVVSTSVSEDEDDPTGSIVVRVPAPRFGDALADLESLGTVASETVSGQDVTQEFIDLEARLRNYTAQETVLLRLMDRAQSVSDTIRVQNELQRVQLEIERLRGRITYLEDQTSMSTIELRVGEEGAVGAPPGEFEKAWERAKDGMVAVITGLIASLGVIVPLAALAMIVVFAFVRLRPKVGSHGA